MSGVNLSEINCRVVGRVLGWTVLTRQPLQCTLNRGNVGGQNAKKNHPQRHEETLIEQARQKALAENSTLNAEFWRWAGAVHPEHSKKVGFCGLDGAGWLCSTRPGFPAG